MDTEQLHGTIILGAYGTRQRQVSDVMHFPDTRSRDFPTKSSPMLGSPTRISLDMRSYHIEAIEATV